MCSSDLRQEHERDKQTDVAETYHTEAERIAERIDMRATNLMLETAAEREPENRHEHTA